MNWNRESFSRTPPCGGSTLTVTEPVSIFSTSNFPSRRRIRFKVPFLKSEGSGTTIWLDVGGCVCRRKWLPTRCRFRDSPCAKFAAVFFPAPQRLVPNRRQPDPSRSNRAERERSTSSRASVLIFVLSVGLGLEMLSPLPPYASAQVHDLRCSACDASVFFQPSLFAL